MHSGRDREGPVLLRKPKESGRTESCEKDFVSNNIRIAVCLIFAKACQFITGKSSMTRDPLEFTGGEGAGEGPNIPEGFRLEKH